jgi:hypothetical protein
MRVALAALLLLMLCATGRAQPAATVVTGCQNAQQPGGSNLFGAVARAASPNSRPVIFECPPNTVIRINPDAAIQIRGHVVIDGDNKITIDAAGQRNSVFTVPGGIGASLTLKNIRIRGAQRAQFTAAGVVFSHESLVLDNVTIEGSDFPVRALGDLTVRNSRFTGNTGTVLLIGDSSREGGAALIENSHFIANAAAAVIGGRTTTVRASRFVGNDSGVSLKGGSINGSLFQANKTAGIVMGGRMDTNLSGNTFENNGAGVLMFAAGVGSAVRVRIARNLYSGHTMGAVVVGEFGNVSVAPPPGSRIVFDVLHNRFLRNSAERGAGVVVSPRGMAPHVKMQARGNVFHDNVAKASGGAIYWAGEQLAISHSLFRGNRAATGGAVFARPSNGAPLSIANTLIVESGGAAIDVAAATILNTTIARNKGHGVLFADPAAVAVIANTIFDQNSDGNCAGVAARVLQRGNIQFGFTDCPGVTVMNPNLDSLYVPALGSAAAEAGDGAICDAAPVDGVDLLFQKRGVRHCSSGAYERPPVRAAAEKPRLVRTCPDGTRVRLGRPCAEQLKVCIGGQSVPVDAVCPCQQYGQVCRASGDCCNNVPCTNGRCRYP